MIFEDALKEEYLRTALIEQELKLALQREEFYLCYQPQVYSDGRLHGVEALIRWRNDKLGEVSPMEFIPIAETTGIIKDIGRYVINRSLREMGELMEHLGRRFHLSINVSAKQFAQQDFVSCVMDEVSASKVENELVCVEITETTFIKDQRHVNDILNDLRRRKIQVSLDDFGTGYSSMGILRNLPIDELKIDKSFIDEIAVDEHAKQIVYSITIIARSLGFKIVAEGVESLEQKSILDEFACDIYQGYLFAKPLSYDELLEKLEANGGVFRPNSPK